MLVAGGPAVLRLTAWLVVAATFTGLVKLGVDELDGGPAGWLWPMGTVLVAVLVLVPLHEGGHLLAALLLRFKVTKVVISYTARSYVLVRTTRLGRALPLRFTLLHLAGPAVDATVAVVLFRWAAHPMSSLIRVCLLVAALTAAFLALGNLLPHSPGGVTTDGAHLLRWIFRPARTRAAVTASPPAGLRRPAGPAIDRAALRRVVDESIDDAGLNAFIEATSDRRAVAIAVFLRLRRTLGLLPGRPLAVENVTIGPAAAADYIRLQEYVISPSADAAVLDALATTLGVLPGLWQLHRATVSGLPPHPAIVARIEAIAAALAHRRPDAESRRIVGAVVDLLHERPAEARRALIGISPAVSADGTYAPLVRAIAEAALGDHAQADRLVNAVRRARVEAGRPGADDPMPVVADVLAARRAGPSLSTNGTNGITTDVRQ
ncbi:hypothetical protein ACQPZJ_28840 [Actinoplanes sp. CA-054009]